MGNSLKTHEEVLEERIIDDTFATFKTMHKKSRPKEINLHNTNPAHLVRIMIGLQERFKKLKYEPVFFFNQDKDGRYPINVGHYLETLKV